MGAACRSPLPTAHALVAAAGLLPLALSHLHPCTRLRAGLLHRAVYVWVFNSEGALLVQRRSPAKRIGPGQWDLSVAEHLQPGETYLQASGGVGQ